MRVKQHRGVVVARKGVVAASQPLAVSTGLHVLQKGGNFADAALAASAVLCVVEPYASHLGGDAFLIVYDAATGKTTALNGSGAAPNAATPDRFPNGIPLRGLSAAAVPGLVAMWFTVQQRWGTLPVADLLAPAIDYAANGFPAGFRYTNSFQREQNLLRQFPDTARALMPDGLPTPGKIVRQPDLAWTLRQIAEGGRAAFYEGDIAEKIVRYSHENGGLFALEDFAAHQTQITDPLKTTYRGYTVHGQPPVSQGHILLQMLNLIEGFDLAKSGHNTPETLHLQVEAKKLAFADRNAYLGDPNFVNVPMAQLLSKAYAAERRSQIRPDIANPTPTPGEIQHDTTYFCVADADGNAVSFIQSVFWGFGSGVVADGTGILFNNRMTSFSLDPTHPNALVPGKRPAHTLNAYLVTKENGPASGSKLAYVGGTPGGNIQVQSNLQVLCNVLDFGMNPQEAIEADRWQHGAMVSDIEEVGEFLEIEEPTFGEVAEALRAKGHAVRPLAPLTHGSSYQLIALDPETGTYLAGSDPRCDGQAAGF